MAKPEKRLYIISAIIVDGFSQHALCHPFVASSDEHLHAEIRRLRNKVETNDKVLQTVTWTLISDEMISAVTPA